MSLGPKNDSLVLENSYGTVSVTKKNAYLILNLQFQLAKYEFQVKPVAALCAINIGILPCEKCIFCRLN